MSIAFSFDGFVTQSAAQAGAPPVADTVPDAFGWATKTGQSLGATVEADTAIVLTGIDADAAFTVSGGTVQINGGSWVSSGTYSPGGTIKPRGVASGSFNATVTVTVTVGGVSGDFNIATYGAPAVLAARVISGGGAIEVVFNRGMTSGADGFSGVAVSGLPGGAATLTYASGDGASSLIYSTSRILGDTEAGVLAFTKPVDGIQDADGNLVDSFTLALRAYGGLRNMVRPAAISSRMVRPTSGSVV